MNYEKKYKEVDLKKEFYDFLDTLIGKDNVHLSEDELFRIAEYFYELGLKAKGEQVMKANEAPEKIQVHLIKNNCDDWSIRGYSFLEDKQIGMTEYTRTDTLKQEWRPSEEQLNALHDAAVYVDKSMFPYPKGILMKLYKQLKKLMEE